MPLPLPQLDDRRWADLVDEGKALLVRNSPGVTDHNIHDPVITLIDLYAWLTEILVYRANQVPESHRRRFLSFIGYSPLPPQPAEAMLYFEPAAGAPLLALPAGIEFADYRTLRALNILPLELAALLVEAEDGTFADYTHDFLDGVPVSLFGAAFYIGFAAITSGVTVTLGFTFDGPSSGLAERRRIIAEWLAQQEACRPVNPGSPCPGSPPSPAPSKTLPPHHSVRLIWETFTGTDWTAVAAMDDTRSLTLDGIVEFAFPAGASTKAVGPVGTPLFYLRVRVDSGAYDAPVQLQSLVFNAAMSVQSTPAWRTFILPPSLVPSGPVPAVGSTTRFSLGFDTKGAVSLLTFHTAATSNGPDVLVLAYQPPGPLPGSLTVELVFAGIGNGLPGQQVLLKGPVEQESLRIFTLVKDDWQEWTLRENFDASLRVDRHFLLDTMTGAVTFGNGERGRAAPKGATVFATYHATDAAQGRVAAGAINSLAPSPHNTAMLTSTQKLALTGIVRNLASSGGEDAEDVTSATARAVETMGAHAQLLELASRKRQPSLDQIAPTEVRAILAPTNAVNVLDIERNALDVPGTRVARARATANYFPELPCFSASGVVTVVVIPDMPVPKPVPSTGLLGAVKRYLFRRRMLTTRIEVRAPEYLEVRVVASVRMKPGASAAGVKTRVLDVLNKFLDPRAGGPEGLGWPFGRDVYRSEILQIIDGTPGVDCVLALSLESGTAAPSCGNLGVCPSALVTSGAHRIEVSS
jgi:hypothetical protein